MKEPAWTATCTPNREHRDVAFVGRDVLDQHRERRVDPRETGAEILRELRRGFDVDPDKLLRAGIAQGVPK